jgi:lipoyl(octanoyl) transferase
MLSEVETSRGITKGASGFLDFAPLGMTEPLFCRLQICHDISRHSPAMNMAIDEALLETTAVPSIRFYRWRSPALSFGYFGRFADVAIYAAQRDLVRRWTGGGIVLHGDDLTYSIVIPASDRVFHEASIAIYEKIHRAVAGALNGVGEHAVVAGDIDAFGLRTGTRAAASASGYNCFANPVRADVMMDGRKVAGAAQRRTRRGLLQQGSIQGFAVKTDLTQKFSQALSANCREFQINEEIFQRAKELAHQKYGAESWLKKR